MDVSGHCLHSLFFMNAITGNLSLFIFLIFLTVIWEEKVSLDYHLPEVRLSHSLVKGFVMVL